MSTHVLDVSGQRGLNLTINDPARTGATCPAKAGDDVHVQIGNMREVRLQLPDGARIQRREYVSRKQVIEEGRAKKDNKGEFVYEETPYEGLVLVLAGSVSLFGRCSFIPVEGEEAPSYENTPHTSLSARRMGESLHFTESGKLIEELDLKEYLPRSMGAE